jgi:hypothetical protein
VAQSSVAAAKEAHPSVVSAVASSVWAKADEEASSKINTTIIEAEEGAEVDDSAGETMINHSEIVMLRLIFGLIGL